MNEVATWIDQFALCADSAGIERLLADRPDLLHQNTLERLVEAFSRAASDDMSRAERIANVASCLADRMGDDTSKAIAWKMQGHLAFMSGDYEGALQSYAAAVSSFDATGSDLDAARVMASSITALIYLGRFDEARKAASDARHIYEKYGDRLRLARLDANTGNIFHRQDRFAEALECYRGALGIFRDHGAPQDLASALFNVAVCSIALGAFDDANAAYRELLEICHREGMHLLEVKADYNIAYLHFLKGEYAEAIRLYQLTRTRCLEIEEDYHRALCDLDQAEIFLELNLGREARHLAHLAHVEFTKLKMGYEAAKSLVFLAVAETQMQRLTAGLDLLARARTTFEAEGNEVWQQVVDLYRAATLCEDGRLVEAEPLARSALRFFEAHDRPAQAVEARLVLARIYHGGGRFEAALEAASGALAVLAAAPVPALEVQAHVATARAEEGLGYPDRARHALESARDALDRVRTHLRAEHVALGFHRDKVAVHQGLVDLTLRAEPSPDTAATAFRLMEEAKSAHMADLLAFHVSALQPAQPAHSPLVRKIRDLRERLNWYSRQIQLEELQADGAPPERLVTMRADAREVEERLLTTLSELRADDASLGWLHGGGALDPDEIRSTVPDGTALLELYEARGTLFAAVITPEGIAAAALASASRVREEQRLLHFQLSKMQLGPGWTDAMTGDLEASARTHLQRLHELLITPIRDRLETADELVVIPHGTLHQLPFAALFDGETYLVDRWPVTVAPSAGVWTLAMRRPASRGRGDLVLGVTDDAAPWARREAEAVASAMPGAAVYLGDAASSGVLRTTGAAHRRIHLSAPAMARRDNPMFSAIPFSDGPLSVFDLYRLRLDADLVSVSGCGAGLGMVASGDELVGLTRGLLYAGARTALVSLWDVRDDGAAAMHADVYRRLADDPHPARALRGAMLARRERDPHPFSWASLVVAGANTPPPPAPS